MRGSSYSLLNFPFVEQLKDKTIGATLIKWGLTQHDRPSLSQDFDKNCEQLHERKSQQCVTLCNKQCPQYT
jgi:hypothetical protein